jgi:nicotinate-nucleotide adenylyltransferase
MVTEPYTIPPETGIFLVDASTPPVSSTDIRERLAARRPVLDLVPAAVAAYIEKHGLYGPLTGAA